MTKKEYLKCYQKACKRIDEISKELNTLDSNIDVQSIDYAAVRVQSSSNGDGAIINAVNKSMYLYKCRLETYDLLTELISDINNSIEGLENDFEQRLLDYHFRDDLTFSNIAELMNYSERHLRRIYNKALSHLIMPDKYIELTEFLLGL